MRILRQQEAFSYRLAAAENPAMAEAVSKAGLNVTDSAPAKDRPVMLVYGGAFNPPHEGHIGALQDAHNVLAGAGYQVGGSIVAPTADKLLAKKQLDPRARLNLQARANVSRVAFPKEMNGAPVVVHTGPSEEVERGVGKPRRSDLANWAQRQYPNHTIVNVTGEDATVPGAPAQHPSLYSGEIGSHHEGINYLTLPRDTATSMSSSRVRAAEAAGEPIPGMTPESERAYREELAKHRASLDPAGLIASAYHVLGAAEDEMLNSYLAQAHRNLAATSRTAQGVVDTSSSPQKAQEMSGVGGQQAADLATKNFHDAIRAGFDQRHRQFASPGEVRQFVEGLAQTVNKGILRPDASLVRTHDSDKFPYTRAKDLPQAMDRFYGDLHARLSDPHADPVETAAYAEYGVDPGHHLFTDGNGKTAKALSSHILMRHGLPLPTYPGGRDEYYRNVTRTTPTGTDPAADEEAFGQFLNYYRSMMPASERSARSESLQSDLLSWWDPPVEVPEPGENEDWTPFDDLPDSSIKEVRRRTKK